MDIIEDRRIFVEGAADAVTTEVTHDAVAVGLGVAIAVAAGVGDVVSVGASATVPSAPPHATPRTAKRPSAAMYAMVNPVLIVT